MNDWAANHPEEYREIAALPLHMQNEALRDAIGYDPDRIRDEYEDNLDGEQRAGAEVPAPRPGHVLGHREPKRESTSPGGVASYSSGRGLCAVCGAGPEDDCAPWCRAEQIS